MNTIIVLCIVTSFIAPFTALAQGPRFDESGRPQGWTIVEGAGGAPRVIHASSDPADTAWDNPFGSGISGTVYAIAAKGEELYVGGFFSIAGGVPANNVAKWDGSTWSALGSGTNNTVLTLAVIGNDVYAGGNFDSAGGISVNHIAKWDGSGWSSLGSGTNGLVYDIVEFNSNVYAGGSFSTAGGSAAGGFAFWNGSTWTGYTGGGTGTVYDMAVSGTDLYLTVFYFQIIVGEPVERWGVKKWDGGTMSFLLGGLFNGEVTELTVIGTDVYAAGLFSLADAVSANQVVRWNGSSWSALGAGIGGGTPYSMTSSGTDLYVGGHFSTAGDSAANNIAKWDGSAWTPLGSGIVTSPSQYVYALAPGGVNVYAGGNFDTAGAKPTPKLARWKLATPPDWSWAGSAGGVNSDRITGLVSDDSGNTYVTGLFDGSIDFGDGPILSAGSRDFFLAKYDPDGDLVWAQAEGGTGIDVAAAIARDPEGNIVVVGNFLSPTLQVDTISLLRPTGTAFEDLFIVKYDPDGRALWARAAGGIDRDLVNDVEIDSAGNVFIGGQFASASIQFGSTVTLINVEPPTWDYFVARYDPQGTAEWSVSEGLVSSNDAIINGIAVNPAGEVWFTGRWGPGVLYGWYDTAGVATINGGTLGVGEGIVIGDSGAVYFTGSFTDTTVTFGGIPVSNAGGTNGTSDIFVVKSDPAGIILWARQAGGTGTDIPTAITVDDSGGIYLTGSFSSPALDLGPFTLANSASSALDVFLARYDAAGVPSWVRQIGSSQLENSYDLHVDIAGNVLIGGAYVSPTVRFGTHTLTNSGAGTSDCFVAKLGDNPIYVEIDQSTSLHAGWNLVSLPVTVSNDSVHVLFPLASSGAFAYTQSGYVPRPTCGLGGGYWLKFPSAGENMINGFPIAELSVPVFEGWNLIGSLSAPIAAGSIASNPPGIVTGNFFAYTGSYVTADTISPGKAYWVKVEQGGELVLSSSAASPTNRIRIVQTGELPPAPPVDAGHGPLDGPGRRSSAIPDRFDLEQNFPNPFNPATVIRYALPVRTLVSLKIFNVLGQEVATLIDETQDAGYRSVTWNAAAVPAGVYFYRLQTSRFEETKKFLLMK